MNERPDADERMKQLGVALGGQCAQGAAPRVTD